MERVNDVIYLRREVRSIILFFANVINLSRASSVVSSKKKDFN